MTYEDFFLGLAAGEGCFMIAVKSDSGMVCGVRIVPIFQVEMAESGNILEELCGELGVGHVHEKPPRTSQSRPTKVWSVRGLPDIKKLIKIIDSADSELFKKSDKGSVYTEWKKAVETKEQSETSDPDAVKRLIHIAKSLNPGDRGRSAEDWCAIVDESVK